MKQSIKIIAGVFVFFAFIFLIIAIFILFLGNDKENSKLVKDNYYVDDNNVKINNSELISEKHFPKNSKSKDLEISISEMVINSTYQSEDKMDVVAYLNNETENVDVHDEVPAEPQKQEKLFTQEEVNNIIEKRLNKEKSKGKD